MKFKSTLLAITLATTCQLTIAGAANSQATTLSGSVFQNSAAVQPVPLRAQTGRYDSYRAPRQPVVYRKVYVEDRRPYFQRHPKVKSAVVGAGVGAGAGAVTGLVSGRGVLRGAAIGAGTGAGVGLIRSSRTMKRHPLARDLATGAAVGFGLGAASSRRGGTMAKSAAIGTAVGGGYHFLKKMF